MEKPIRILQCGLTNNIGGVEKFIINLYESIDRQKIQFDFLTTHDGKIAFEEEIKELGGNIYRVTYSRKESLIKHYKELDKFFNTHREIVGVHMNSCFINYILPIRMARKYNLPIRIFHSHNSSNMYTNTSYIYKLLEEKNKKVLPKITTNLLACSKQAGRYMFDDNNFEVINNGIESEKYKFDKETRDAYRKKMNIPLNSIVIGFVGRLQYQKNPLFALKVFQEICKINNNTILVVIGQGELKSEMDKYIKSEGLENKVIFMGMINNVNELYNIMDLVLFPSIFEGLGIVAIEAQANGVPIFISDVFPTEVDITNKIYRKSLNESPKSWAIDMLSIIDKSDDRENNSDIIKKSGFDIKEVSKKIEKIYLEQLKNKKTISKD